MLNKENFSVSVIIPVFNGEKYLGEAIESVFAQTLKPLEILVINDGSDDHTEKIVKNYSDEIEYYSQNRMGTGYSRNRGIELAKGNFIAHLDADDIWDPNKLLRQYEAFCNNDDVEIVGCLMKSFYSPELTQETMKNIYCPPEPIQSYSASAIVLKREVYAEVGLYEEKVDNTPDFEWFIRVREKRINEFMIEEVLCHRRLHHSNSGIMNKDANRERLNLLKMKLDRSRLKRDGS